jgi:hypothetical protein
MSHDLKCGWRWGLSAQQCGQPATYAIVSKITGSAKFTCDTHTFLADRIFKEIPIEEYLVKQVMES